MYIPFEFQRDGTQFRTNLSFYKNSTTNPMAQLIISKQMFTLVLQSLRLSLQGNELSFLLNHLMHVLIWKLTD